METSKSPSLDRVQKILSMKVLLDLPNLLDQLDMSRTSNLDDDPGGSTSTPTDKRTPRSRGRKGRNREEGTTPRRRKKRRTSATTSVTTANDSAVNTSAAVEVQPAAQEKLTPSHRPQESKSPGGINQLDSTLTLKMAEMDSHEESSVSGSHSTETRASASEAGQKPDAGRDILVVTKDALINTPGQDENEKMSTTEGQTIENQPLRRKAGKEIAPSLGPDAMSGVADNSTGYSDDHNATNEALPTSENDGSEGGDVAEGMIGKEYIESIFADIPQDEDDALAPEPSHPPSIEGTSLFELTQQQQQTTNYYQEQIVEETDFTLSFMDLGSSSSILSTSSSSSLQIPLVPQTAPQSTVQQQQQSPPCAEETYNSPPQQQFASPSFHFTSPTPAPQQSTEMYHYTPTTPLQGQQPHTSPWLHQQQSRMQPQQSPSPYSQRGQHVIHTTPHPNTQSMAQQQDTREPPLPVRKYVVVRHPFAPDIAVKFVATRELRMEELKMDLLKLWGFIAAGYRNHTHQFQFTVWTNNGPAFVPDSALVYGLIPLNKDEEWLHLQFLGPHPLLAAIAPQQHKRRASADDGGNTG